MAQMWNKETPERREQVVVTHDDGVEHRQRIVENKGVARRVTGFKLTQAVWLLFGLLEGLIILRIALKLIAANPANPFAAFIYQITDIFLWPFFGLTATPAVGGMVLEISSIIGLIVYALLAWAVTKIIDLIFYRYGETHVVETYDHDHRDVL